MIKNYKNLKILTFNVLIFLVMLFVSYSQRNISNISTDTDLWNYLNFFENSSNSEANLFQYELFFSAYTWILSKFTTFNFYLALFPFWLYLGYCSALEGIVKNKYKTLLLSFLITMFYPVASSMSEVILRQGLAAAVLLFALPSVIKRSCGWRRLGIVSILMVFIHYSSVFAIIALLVLRWSKGRSIFFFWILILILYLANLSGLIGLNIIEFSGVEATALSAFSEGNVDYKLGFKFLFFALSIFPLIIYYILRRMRLTAKEKTWIIESDLNRFYFLLNSFAMCFSLSAFHDRLFGWSWILIPLIVFSMIKSFSFSRSNLKN